MATTATPPQPRLPLWAALAAFVVLALVWVILTGATGESSGAVLAAEVMRTGTGGGALAYVALQVRDHTATLQRVLVELARIAAPGGGGRGVL